MISPLAYVHPAATLGPDVTIDPFAVVHQNTSIGAGTHIMSHSVVLPHSHIGAACLIFPGAVIGAVPQDLKFVGEETTVEIGDNTTIRECVTINRGTKDKWKTAIGSHCLIMAYAHIAHDCVLGDYVILANGVQLAGHVTVGDYANMGGLSGANQFTRIGAHTYIAGHTVVRKDVPPFIKAGREPMSYAGVNVVGLQRRQFQPEQIQTISQIYHLLFVQKGSTTTAVQAIQEQVPDGPLKSEVLQFVQESSIGIIKRAAKTEFDDN